MQFPRLENPWMFVVIGLRSCLEYRNIILCFASAPRYLENILRKNNIIFFHNLHDSLQSLHFMFQINFIIIEALMPEGKLTLQVELWLILVN